MRFSFMIWSAGRPVPSDFPYMALVSDGTGRHVLHEAISSRADANHRTNQLDNSLKRLLDRTVGFGLGPQ
jgi:hypothetical protein